MMTPFSIANRDLSQSGHLKAREVIYPALFANRIKHGDQLTYEDTCIWNGERGQVLDGEQATDRIIYLYCRRFANQPKGYEDAESALRRIPLTVQERFRDPVHQNNQDLTITVWNPHSRTPSEMFKLMAQWFLYGYYDLATDTHAQTLLVNVSDMMMGIIYGSLSFKSCENPRTKQPFVAIPFEALYAHKAVRAEWRNNQLVWCAFTEAA